jgi:hypothetical protein
MREVAVLYLPDDEHPAFHVLQAWLQYNPGSTLALINTFIFASLMALTWADLEALSAFVVFLGLSGKGAFLIDCLQFRFEVGLDFLELFSLHMRRRIGSGGGWTNGPNNISLGLERPGLYWNDTIKYEIGWDIGDCAERVHNKFAQNVGFNMLEL